jgi:hypothetical protein
MTEFNDWSTHLLQAEGLLRNIEDKLLHKQRDGLAEDVDAAVLALFKTLAWAQANPDK